MFLVYRPIIHQGPCNQPLQAVPGSMRPHAVRSILLLDESRVDGFPDRRRHRVLTAREAVRWNLRTPNPLNCSRQYRLPCFYNMLTFHPGRSGQRCCSRLHLLPVLVCLRGLSTTPFALVTSPTTAKMLSAMGSIMSCISSFTDTSGLSSPRSICATLPVL
jgi:hypothetical protein